MNVTSIKSQRLGFTQPPHKNINKHLILINLSTNVIHISNNYKGNLI